MQGTLWLDNIAEINYSEQLYYTYFEVNCKQKVIFIQCSQRVLYVHARRVLSIIRAWFLFYVKHVLQYASGQAAMTNFIAENKYLDSPFELSCSPVWVFLLNMSLLVQQ